MLQLRSICDVADNTGAKRAAIIGVLGEAKRFGEIGDIVKAHIKEAAPDGTVKKSETPITENQIMRPASPNAVSKAFQDLVSQV